MKRPVFDTLKVNPDMIPPDDMLQKIKVVHNLLKDTWWVLNAETTIRRESRLKQNIMRRNMH